MLSFWQQQILYGVTIALLQDNWKFCKKHFNKQINTICTLQNLNGQPPKAFLNNLLIP